jgi:hypothetical protein
VLEFIRAASQKAEVKTVRSKGVENPKLKHLVAVFEFFTTDREAATE